MWSTVSIPAGGHPAARWSGVRFSRGYPFPEVVLRCAAVERNGPNGGLKTGLMLFVFEFDGQRIEIPLDGLVEFANHVKQTSQELERFLAHGPGFAKPVQPSEMSHAAVERSGTT